MRFCLLDRIVELTPGTCITAVKSPTLTEEFLQDHFPLFPVMPGVLMLESMYQASAWLIRVTDDFAQSMVLLKEARNIKYAGFVRPGQTLRVTAEIASRQDGLTNLKVKGTVDQEKAAVSARIVLEQFNLADRDPNQSAIDQHIRNTLRRELDVLMPPTAHVD